MMMDCYDNDGRVLVFDDGLLGHTDGRVLVYDDGRDWLGLI
jgi:hypothetical protein